MLTPEEKMTKLNALESAILDGVLKIEYSDKKIEYRSLKEMISIRNMLRKECGLSKSIKRTQAVYGGY